MDYNNLTDQWAKLRPQISIGRILSYYRTLIKEKSSMALCPFHDDHTPSMHVDEILGLYHCFSCGASGDSISFIRQKENCDFLQAIEKACDICGIAFSFGNKQENIEHEKLYKINAAFCHYFEEQLLKRTLIIDYLKNRSINLDQIKKYRLGYAPSIKESQLQNKPMPNHYNHNHFAGRIIFPIIDAENKILGFGGRSLLEENRPKYVNSAENAIFNKKNLVYGSQWLGCDKNQPIYLVEGYLDAIKIRELGYRAAALMGSSCSPSAFKTLCGKTNRLVLALDRDSAGIAALENIINQTVLPWLRKNIQVSIALYREKDPGDSADCSDFRHKTMPLAQYCQFYLEKKHKNSKAAFDDFVALSKKIPDPEVRKEFYNQWEKNYSEKERSQEKIKNTVANQYLNKNKKDYYVQCVRQFPNILRDVDKSLKLDYVNDDLDYYLEEFYNSVLAIAETEAQPEKQEIFAQEDYKDLLFFMKKLLIQECINFLYRQKQEGCCEEKSQKLLKTLAQFMEILRKQ